VLGKYSTWNQRAETPPGIITALRPVTGFSSRPSPSISTVTVSRAFSQTGGVRAKPTPCGVPVRMMLPGRSVIVLLRLSIRAGTSKIMSEVELSCMTWPLTIVFSRSAFGLAISSRVVIHGPSGQKPSNDFPRANWPAA
jgi:hypothetical protein